MSKTKEKPKKPAKTEAAEAVSGEEGAPAKMKPPIMIIGLGAILFLGAGAGVFFLAPSNAVDTEAQATSEHGEKEVHGAKSQKSDAHAKDAHGEKKSHGEKNGHGGGHGDKGGAEGAVAPPALGQFTVAGDTAFYLPDPFVVSLDPRIGPRHLKIALAIEAPPETASLYEERSLRLRDAMTTYLRAIDAAAISDPAAMSSIRQQLKRRIEYVVSPENVKDVLILDFILT